MLTLKRSHAKLSKNKFSVGYSLAREHHILLKRAWLSTGANTGGGTFCGKLARDTGPTKPPAAPNPPVDPNGPPGNLPRNIGSFHAAFAKY
jgi:hypothetical protein